MLGSCSMKLAVSARGISWLAMRTRQVSASGDLDAVAVIRGAGVQVKGKQEKLRITARRTRRERSSPA
jgi:hypothetical protein